MNLNTCDPEKLSLKEKIKLVRETDGLLIDLLEGEIIKVNLNFNKCTSLTHLPENFKVEGCLDLSDCTSLTHLPENLKVEGSLDLWGCTSLTHLPENLKVEGNLWLEGCTSLKSIPDSVQVEWNIFLPYHLKQQRGLYEYKHM